MEIFTVDKMEEIAKDYPGNTDHKGMLWCIAGLMWTCTAQICKRLETIDETLNNGIDVTNYDPR